MSYQDGAFICTGPSDCECDQPAAYYRDKLAVCEKALDEACENIAANNHLENIRNKRSGDETKAGVWFIETAATIRKFYLDRAKDVTP